MSIYEIVPISSKIYKVPSNRRDTKVWNRGALGIWGNFIKSLEGQENQGKIWEKDSRTRGGNASSHLASETAHRTETIRPKETQRLLFSSLSLCFSSLIFFTSSVSTPSCWHSCQSFPPSLLALLLSWHASQLHVAHLIETQPDLLSPK